MIETIQSGKPETAFLKHGDRVEIDVRDAQGHSIFGRIEQDVVKAS
jgi:fumarylacetoacetate (FAA) hydrolase